MDIATRRHLPFDRLHNFRDFGGYPSGEGRHVRWGQLYRSDSLGKLAGDDLDRFSALGIQTVIDLRYSWEADAAGRVPETAGLAYYNLSVEHRPYDQTKLSEADEPVRFLADRYAEVAEDGVAELGQALRIMAAGGSAPLVIHCASGKDRTGLLAAVVLTLLGVSDDDVVADYALTALATGRIIADWKAAFPGEPLFWPHYGQAPAEVMRVFLAELAARFGSVREYVTGYLGVEQSVIDGLTSLYTAAGSPAVS